MKKVILYTDGACSGNPGVGGWGAVLMFKGAEKRISGAEAETTNNRMEMRLTRGGYIPGRKTVLKKPIISPF